MCVCYLAQVASFSVCAPVLSSPFVARLRCRARIRILHTCCRTTPSRSDHGVLPSRRRAAARRRGSNAPWLRPTPFGSPSSRTSSAGLRFGGICMQLAVSCRGAWRRSLCRRWAQSSLFISMRACRCFAIPALQLGLGIVHALGVEAAWQ